MQTTPAPSRTAIRVRRGLSIALSSLTIVIAGSVLALIIMRPAIYLGEGISAMPPLPQTFVESLSFVVLLPIAAAILLSGLPRTTKPDAVPKVFCIAAFALLGIALLWPVLSVLVGLLGALATLG